MHIDRDRHKELGKFEKELRQVEPMEMFVCIESRLKEVKDIVKKARASSIPDPRVYKNCPMTLFCLLKLIKVF